MVILLLGAGYFNCKAANIACYMKSGLDDVVLILNACLWGHFMWAEV